MTPIGEATDYHSLVALLSARIRQLDVSYATLDGITGLADGYVSKLFAPAATKTMGWEALELLLAALGMKLIGVEDANALRRVRNRLIPLKKHDNASGRMRRSLTTAGRLLNQARATRVPAARRRAIAQYASRTRWARKRAKLRDPVPQIHLDEARQHGAHVLVAGGQFLDLPHRQA